MIARIALTSILLLSLSCAAGVQTRRIDAKAPTPKPGGLVVNHKTPQRVIAIFPEEPGSQTLATKTTIMALPDPNELYVLDFSGALFRTVSLDVELLEDGTLKHVRLDSKQEAGAALERFNKSAQNAVGLMKTLDEIEAAKEKAAKEQADEAAGQTKAELTLQKEELALQLEIAKAEKELAELQAGPKPPADLSVANQDLQLELKNLMLEANRAAIRAGEPLPFQGVLE